MATDEERLKNIYRRYLEEICPLIIKYEVLTNEFPTHLLNEIRSLFLHLSKYQLSEDPENREKNLLKAESHLKRSFIDCFKHLCVAYDDRFQDFERLYRNVDLSLINEGKFLIYILDNRKLAMKMMSDARETDLQIKSGDKTKIDEAYEKYRKAYLQYRVIDEEIGNNYQKLENLKKRTTLKGIFSLSGWVIVIFLILLKLFSLF